MLGVLQRAAPNVKSTTVHRTSVTKELDLVLAVAGAEIVLRIDGPGFAWTENELLGLFLQDRGNPNLVFTITLAPGTPDCWARVERATATDTVLSCTAEKVGMNPSQKFVYDVRAKELVRRLGYQPFAMARVFPRQQSAIFVGTDISKLLAVDFQLGRQPEFEVMSEAASQPWFAWTGAQRNNPGDESLPIWIPQTKHEPLRFGPGGVFGLTAEEDALRGTKLVLSETRRGQTTRHELPKSTFDAFAAARPESVKNGNRRGVTEMDERIGPHQLFDGKLWFGKTFYDSEGLTGIGGFGYFDPDTARYILFSSPEIKEMSVSAILVEADAVWLALIHRGEYGNTGGGVLRFDRATQTYKRYETPGRIVEIVRVGDRLLLPNHLGIDTIGETGLKRYFVDKTTDGRLRVAVVEK